VDFQRQVAYVVVGQCVGFGCLQANLHGVHPGGLDDKGEGHHALGARADGVQGDVPHNTVIAADL